MADFTKSIKLVVDFVGGNAKGQIKGLSEEVSNAEGAWGKMKAAGGGAMDFIKSNAGAFALSAGAAIAAFGAKAVGDFEDVALGAGHLRDALGLSADEASRWQEVANDLGIGTDKLETSFGKMLKTAGATPQVFKDLGVEIAHAKDGSVDANGTFLNVIDRLHAMKDPAERAAAAQQLLGKSWRDAAELIALGADGVRARLQDVTGAKIVDDKQIADAKKFRDAMDNLHDAIENISLSIGSELVPTLSGAANAIVPVVDAVGKLHDGLVAVADVPVAGWIVKDLINPFARLQQGIGLLQDAWHSMFGGGGDGGGKIIDDFSKEYNASLSSMTAPTEATQASTKAMMDQIMAAGGQFKILSDGTMAAVDATGKVPPTADEAAKAEAALAAKVKDANDRFNEQIDALRKQQDAMHGSADATLAANDAQVAFTEKATESNKVQTDAKSTTEQKTSAVQSERDAMIDAAKAQQEKIAKDSEAKGVTASATTLTDAFNSSLLNNAHFATPAARDAISDYIIEANGIPASKGTDIRAAIARGDFDTAAALLAQLSADRAMSLNVDADTHQARQEIKALDGQHITIYGDFVPTGRRLFASGGTAGAGGGVAGEHYKPEILNGDTLITGPTPIPAGTRVTGERETKRLLEGAHGPTYEIHVHAEGTGVAAVMEAQRRALWLAGAKPTTAGIR